MGKPASNVVYMDIDELWHGYEDMVVDIARREGVKSVAELGGGANPIVADADRWGFVPERVVIDISAEELAKAGDGVATRVADLCRPIEDGHNQYDLVFSKFLCEHIADPASFHANCFKVLRPGGLAVHFFPTIHTAPILVNWLIPEEQARSLVRVFQPARLDDPRQEKFPAYYRWTTGPSERATKRFESVGFKVEQTTATFGHGYYRRIPPLHALERFKTRMLHRHPVPYLTSFVAVVLRKPHVGIESRAQPSNAEATGDTLRNASG
jgi:SAM-dependent methyltransferase